jgi:hypothetical protein
MFELVHVAFSFLSLWFPFYLMLFSCVCVFLVASAKGGAENN